jgi:hypothetical protein
MKLKGKITSGTLMLSGETRIEMVCNTEDVKSQGGNIIYQECEISIRQEASDDPVNISSKHVEETPENKHMNNDAKTLQEIRRRLKIAGYVDSPHIPTSVGLLIYERDAANQRVEHLEKQLTEIRKADHELNAADELVKSERACESLEKRLKQRIREIDQKDEEIEELKENIEWMKRNERNWKEEWKAEVAMLNATIKELNKDHKANHEAELASVLTDYYMHTEDVWFNVFIFLNKKGLTDRFKWDGSRFVPVSAEASETIIKPGERKVHQPH